MVLFVHPDPFYPGILIAYLVYYLLKNNKNIYYFKNKIKLLELYHFQKANSEKITLSV